jgi:hypothetical protein
MHDFHFRAFSHHVDRKHHQKPREQVPTNNKKTSETVTHQNPVLKVEISHQIGI